MIRNFTKELDELKSQNRLRALLPSLGLDFTSNDYLGLSHHPALKTAAITALNEGLDAGAGGSRLLRGNHPAHVELEEYAASYFNTPKTLFFSSGFIANYAIFSTLPEKRDTIIFDSLIHASARDGIQSSHARHIRVPHNDLNAYEDVLRRSQSSGGHRWIAVEGVYSMDGDCAPIAQLLELAERYDATIIVDEAHSTGVFGATGKGLTEGLTYNERLITLHTCGKALGIAGALVCATSDIIDYMINNARAFIYSTAPIPLQAVMVKCALEIIQAEPERKERLWQLQAHACKALRIASPSQIIPVMLGTDARAVSVADGLQKQGFDLRAIRPPTVPENTARVRVSINCSLEEEDITSLAAALRTLSLERAA